MGISKKIHTHIYIYVKGGVLKSWEIPSRHHGCSNTKPWLFMTWMIQGRKFPCGDLLDWGGFEKYILVI